jgi:copper(I)-binding protein
LVFFSAAATQRPRPLSVTLQQRVNLYKHLFLKDIFMFSWSVRSCVASAAFMAGLLLSSAGFAQSVEVKAAWVRGTVPAQKVTGAFMELTGKAATRLVAAESPVAGKTEIHHMKMENGVMKMFPMEGIDVPAGKTVKLASGGYHLMLLDLKRELKAGERVPLRLIFEQADKKRETMDLSVEVRAITGERRHAH